jgi:hypothetical protein
MWEELNSRQRTYLTLFCHFGESEKLLPCAAWILATIENLRVPQQKRYKSTGAENYLPRVTKES